MESINANLCPLCGLPVDLDELGKANVEDEPAHPLCVLSEIDDLACGDD